MHYSAQNPPKSSYAAGRAEWVLAGDGAAALSIRRFYWRKLTVAAPLDLLNAHSQRVDSELKRSDRNREERRGGPIPSQRRFRHRGLIGHPAHSLAPVRGDLGLRLRNATGSWSFGHPAAAPATWFEFNV